MAGSAFGDFVFLVGTSIYYASLPRRTDCAAIKVVVFIGLLLGAIGGAIFRSLSGPIHARRTWGISWFVTGAFAAPILFILLIAWAMRGTGGW